MKIRNKQTGQIFEVMKGTLYPSSYEEVKDVQADIERIKVGEPKVEYEIEEEPVLKYVPPKKAKKTTKKSTKSKKGAKKDGKTE